MGKGSKQRPTNKNSFDENFDKIFGGNRVQYQKGNQASAPGRQSGTVAGDNQSPNQTNQGAHTKE